LRKLKRYKPTLFKADDSVYSKQAADSAVAFIQCLNHTKGEWYGQSFELIDWQEQIIRDLFGVLKSSGYRQFNSAYIIAIGNPPLLLLMRIIRIIIRSSQSGFSPASHRACDFHRTRRSID